MLSKISIKNRIYSLSILLLLLLAGVSAIGIVGVQQDAARFLEYRSRSGELRITLELEREIAELRRGAFSFLASGNKADNDEVLARIEALTKQLKIAEETATRPEAKEQLNELARLIWMLGSDFRTAAEAVRQQSKAVEALRLLDKNGGATLSELSMFARVDQDPISQRMLASATDLLSRAQILASRYFAAASDLALAEEANRVFKEFDTTMADLIPFLSDEKRREAATNLKMEAVKASVEFGLGQIGSGHLLEVSARMREKAVAMAAQTGQLKAAEVERMSVTEAEMDDAVAANFKLLAGCSIAGLLIGILAAIRIARAITVPLAKMTQAMRQLAGGDKSLTIPGLDAGAEIGQMATAVEIFRNNMIRADEMAVEQEREQSRRVARSEKIDLLTRKFDTEVGRMLQGVADAASHLESTAQSMSSVATQTSSQANAVAHASEQATASVQSVASAAEQLSASVEEIGRRVAESSRISESAVDAAGRTNNLVRGLSETVQRIGEVVKLIDDIAAQTNLLALNATIEAARAGEAGKGFAVVASEVKSLASQTGKATEEIAEQIGAVQTATRDAVAAIGEIGKIIALINEISTAIAAAVEEQSAATSEIARNAQHAAAGTEEVSGHILGLTQGAQQTDAASQDVRTEAKTMAHQAESLRQQVDSFLGDVRAA